ncbi:hypothetical protein ACFW08_33750 [Streptomyces sp. NPDC058960]|uniref:hypothetical protein n=1 Tax=Streptomyces sp. NPDC058960 TaxID=3346679 RepID=UPI0036872F4B
MTDHATPSPRICPNCDGFASVAITLGGRDRHGHLRTITAHCPACQGTGTAHRTAVREGARA